MRTSRLVRIVLLAGTSLLGFATAAMADPISGAIASAAAFLTSGTLAAAAANAAIGMAINFGMSILSSALTAKPKGMGGIVSEVQIGVDVPRQVIFGRGATAGRFVYWKAVGNSNKVLHLVFQLADWECEALEAIWCSGEKKTLTPVAATGTEHARYQVEGYGDKLIVKFFRGTMTQAADSELVTASAAAGAGIGAWTANHRGAGVCYVALVLTYDDELYQTGLPEFLFEVKGARLYDPRKDTTNGGAGAHRWSDPATWEWSGNPALCDYNFRRGLFRNGQRLLGMGVPASNLLNDHYFAAANVCDEAVTEGGGPEARYTCGVIVSDEAEWRVAPEAFKQAMAGEVLEKRGLFGVLAGAAQTAVATFTADDLILGEDTSFAMKLSRSELINAVYAKYLNPAEQWDTSPLPPLTNSTWETEDNGERRPADLDLQAVYKPFQGSRLAQIVHALARQQATHSGSYGGRFAGVEAGDWVNLSNRFGTFTMKVMSREETAPLVFRFAMRQVAASCYSGVAQTFTPVTPAGPAAPVVITAVAGLAVTGVALAGANGQLRPAIQVTWTPPADPAVTAIFIEWRVAGNPAASRVRVDQAEGGSYTVSTDIMAGTSYEVRAAYERDPARTLIWSAWTAVATTTEYVVATSKIATDTQSLFDALHEDALAAMFGSSWEAIQNWIDASNGLASKSTDFLTLASETNKAQASVIEEQTLRVSADTAIAATLTAVEARTDAGTAFGAFKLEAVSAPSGVTARFEAYVRVDDTSGAWHQAGFFLDIYDSGSGVYKGRFVVKADLFAIDTGTSPVLPFAVVGSETYINRVTVNDQVKSANYAEGADGVPLAGFNFKSDGILRGRATKLADIEAYGASFTKRPVKTAAPIFENGIEVGVGTSSKNLVRQMSFTGGTWDITSAWSFERTPTSIRLVSATLVNGTSYLSPQNTVYPILPGQLLPPAMYSFADGVSQRCALKDDGTVTLQTFDGNGAMTGEYYLTEAPTMRWIYPLEKDATNLLGASKIVAGLGISRRPFPFVVPQCSRLSFKLWGAGGGSDLANNSYYGGPGGYVTAVFDVGDDKAIRAGDVLWVVVGEGGEKFQPNNPLGFGGRGMEFKSRWGGGGLTGIFLHAIARENALVIAGGGGGCDGAARGSPGGHTTWAGSQTGTGLDLMTGAGWYYSGGRIFSPGGGGYIGGIALATLEDGSNPASGVRGGRGGTSFIDTSRLGYVSGSIQFTAASAYGYANLNTPPANTDADYQAYRHCWRTRQLVGEGAVKSAINGDETAGNGLAVIDIAA